MSTHFFDMDRDELRSFAVEHGFRAFIADQLLKWVYQRGVSDLEQMTDISRVNRVRLGGLLHFESSRRITEQRASDGTRKLLLGWIDNAREQARSGLQLLANSCGSAVGVPPGCLSKAASRPSAAVSLYIFIHTHAH